MSSLVIETSTPDPNAPQAAPAADPRRMKSPEELLAIFDANAFNFAAEVPPPSPILSIGDRIIATPGNLVGLQAQAKAGKSAAVGAMIAAVFNGNRQGADTLGFSAENPRGFALVHLDTEQSPSHYDKLVRLAMRRASIEKPPPWFKSYRATAMEFLDRRFGLPHLIERAAQAHDGVFAVILDGGADLIASVNDEEAARGFVSELHRLASKYDCAVIVVLHENPGSLNGKTRGHFGSELERKAETNLQLAKDGNNVTTIWSDRARNCDFPKSAGHCFTWSITEGMHVSLGPAGEIKESEKRCKMASEAAEVFDGENALSFSALVQRIISVLDLKERAAKKRVQTYLAEGVATKMENGSYYLKDE